MTETSPFVVAKNLAYVPAMYLGLSMESYTILAILMLMDTFTGIIRAGVVHGWRSVNSHNLSFGVLSKLSIILIPLVIVLAAKGAGVNLLPVAKASLSALILSEAYSIMGNIQAIRTRKDIVEFDAVAFLLKGLRGTLEKFLKK